MGKQGELRGRIADTDGSHEKTIAEERARAPRASLMAKMTRTDHEALEGRSGRWVADNELHRIVCRKRGGSGDPATAQTSAQSMNQKTAQS
eukprot:6204561-Pleurochrysis_carterae.AAC.4